MNTTTGHNLPPNGAFCHGAHLVFLDALGCGGTGYVGSIRDGAGVFLESLVARDEGGSTAVGGVEDSMECTTDEVFGISPFFIKRGTYSCVIYRCVISALSLRPQTKNIYGSVDEYESVLTHHTCTHTHTLTHAHIHTLTHTLTHTHAHTRTHTHTTEGPPTVNILTASC